MKLNLRQYQTEEDFWKIRAFLRDVILLNDRRELSWPVARWDYWRWHVIPCCAPANLDEVVFIWETQDGQIAAVMNPEGSGFACLQVNPAFRTEQLLEEMLILAEEKLKAVRQHDGKLRLVINSHDRDALLQSILTRRGYEKIISDEINEHVHKRLLDAPISEVIVPEGYQVRSLGGIEEIPSRSWASWRAFHPDSPDEEYEGWEWYLENIQIQPLYRRDLDIVAIAPDGQVAAFTTIWYDDVTRTAYFEPVGTVPEHQQRGLGKAVMTEGLHRLKRMGCVAAFVGGYSVAANALYSSAISPEVDIFEPWIKYF